MDDYFQWLMLLFVIITTIVRAVKGRKVKKVREQLAAVAPLINASVDAGRRSISGKVEGVPFKIKYEPEVENSPARLDLIFEKRLPFNLEVAERITPFDPQQSSQAGEFLLDRLPPGIINLLDQEHRLGFLEHVDGNGHRHVEHVVILALNIGFVIGDREAGVAVRRDHQ